MEPRRQQLGDILSGQGGPALRHAMRSSRAQEKLSVHESKCEEGTDCFELLAAVAGQILQDSGCSHKYVDIKNAHCDISNYQAYSCINEFVSGCNHESTFEADQAEQEGFKALQLVYSSHQSPLASKLGMEGKNPVNNNLHPDNSVQYNSILGQSLPAKISQNQIQLGYSKYSVEDPLLQGRTMEWEGSVDRVHPIAIVEDEGFSAKSDNESGTASVDCKEIYPMQRQSVGRGNMILNLGKQPPCRVNQVPHEYLVKDLDRQPELRVLSEDVHSNDMVVEQEGIFEEECSRLKGLDYEATDCIEAVKDVKAVDDNEGNLLFSKFEQKEGFPGEVSKIPSRSIHVNKEKGSALLERHGTMNKSPNFFRMENGQDNASSLAASPLPKRTPNDENNAPGFCLFVKKKPLHLQSEVSEGRLSKVREEAFASLRCENGFGLTNCNRGSEGCSKRKHAEMAFPAVTGRKLEKKSLYGETAYTKQRSSRVSKFRAKRAVEREGTVPTFALQYNNVQTSNNQCIDGEPAAAPAKPRHVKAVRVASSRTGRASFSSSKLSESRVKVSIKSFAVPELLVDLPESATIADLKKAVMDAAMNVLGGGLRVRVLLKGKKVPDECATLVQLGISRTGKPESLGFMLEPTPTSTASSNFEDPLLLLSHAASQPSPRCATFHHQGVGNEAKGWPCARKLSDTKGGSELRVSATILQDDDTKGNGNDSFKDHNYRQLEAASKQGAALGLQSKASTVGAMLALGGQTESLVLAKHESDSASTLSEVTPLSAHDAGANILHPRESPQEMAMVSMEQSNLLQAGKRRIRRPFSVVEVEALVLAVEKLGTGRWRDIKLMSFNNAKYRTYVDLKDKWKTLVHTAQIAPHQRRGEPVPQELLERVLQANSYWIAHQAKQQAEINV